MKKIAHTIHRGLQFVAITTILKTIATMTPSDLYQTYTEVLQKLNKLQSEYREIPGEENNREMRQALSEQIKTCQEKLWSVTDKLIYSNPFQNGSRIKHGALNETLV